LPTVMTMSVCRECRPLEIIEATGRTCLFNFEGQYIDADFSLGIGFDLTMNYRGSPPNDHLHPTNTLSKIGLSHIFYQNSITSTSADSIL
jgi:hypothetical protein